MASTKISSISFPIRSTGRSWIQNYDIEPVQTVSTRVFTATRTRTGERKPGWRRIIAEGGNATTPLTARWDSVDYQRSAGVWLTQLNPAYPTYVGRRETSGDAILTSFSGNPNPVAPSLDTSFVDNLAKAAFYKELKSHTVKLNGLVFLGELRETLNLLRRPVSTLHNLASDFLGALSKRKRAKPKSWAKDVGSIWLEQRFGWTPLMHDIRDAVKAWGALTKPLGHTLISESAKKRFDRTYDLVDKDRVGHTSKINGGCVYTTVTGVLLETHIVRYRGACNAQVEAPQWADARLFGFAIEEVVPSAWELLPWSFLVDYFTNIGDILDASVTNTRSIAFVNKTVIRTTEKYGTMEHNPKHSLSSFGTGWTTSGYKSDRVTHVLKRREVTRTANSGISLPRFQFNFSLSDGQLGNVAALLTQANSLHPQNKPRSWHR